MWMYELLFFLSKSYCYVLASCQGRMPTIKTFDKPVLSISYLLFLDCLWSVNSFSKISLRSVWDQLLSVSIHRFCPYLRLCSKSQNCLLEKENVLVSSFHVCLNILYLNKYLHYWLILQLDYTLKKVIWIVFKAMPLLLWG